VKIVWGETGLPMGETGLPMGETGLPMGRNRAPILGRHSSPLGDT